MMHLVEALCNNALTTLSTSPGGTDQIQKDAASAQVSADRCRQRWFFYSAKQFFNLLLLAYLQCFCFCLFSVIAAFFFCSVFLLRWILGFVCFGVCIIHE
ncbi:hypothetical protein GOODEAATRI_013072 [Goodea atripinnis]|uniref:Uncharacterized protein n=1 Tax=Goodea atripinnis TaxID=208336 RepID=A0ABV0NU44_9TELE